MPAESRRHPAHEIPLAPLQEHGNLVVIATQVAGSAMNGAPTQNRAGYDAIVSTLQLTGAKRLKISTQPGPQKTRVFYLRARQRNDPFGIKTTVEE